MNLVKVRIQIVPLIVLALVASCSSNQPKETPKSAPAPMAAPAPVTAPMARPVMQPSISENPLHDPGSILSKRSVYYEYDKYEVAPEFRLLVEAHAKYLREHPGATITIQGNCDERGSREYNLALGQRRADNVMKLMTLLGASAGQIETVSFGEEKPKVDGHDEAAWAQNRRSDIVYGRER